MTEFYTDEQLARDLDRDCKKLEDSHYRNRDVIYSKPVINPGVVTNKQFSESESFKNSCATAGVQPTKRQAGKFRNRQGKVYKFQRGC